jgi:light-regulated signal transduction histidine kinase (bacteriophytochrome)
VITDNYGKTFLIGVNADITDQYTKAKMIEEKIADLEKSNKQLIAFNHIASHDLQEPLRKVQTFISRIRENDFETFPEKVKTYFTGIERSTSRMSNLIEDLLLYSRANKADKIFELTDLNKLLENSIQELSQAIEEKSAVIKSLSILPSLNVIPFQIQQLFINIIDTEKIIGKDIPGYTADPNSPFYKISFFDNGIGFEQKYAENIFTLFYRLHSKGEYSGTGIGLSICKIIVENHKGYIFAEGIPNMGTTITIYLPA